MQVPDSNLWIEFVRAQTPHRVRAQVQTVLTAVDRRVCEPIVFELLRASSVAQRPVLEAFLAPVPVLPTPPDLWEKATELGQRCYAVHVIVPPLDLLIAQVCMEHGARLVTFDRDFDGIASVSDLQVDKLVRIV